MQTVALIGYGAIAREVCSALGRASGIRIEQVLVRTGTSQLVQKALPEGITAIERLEDLSPRVGFVLECAGHEAVRSYGPAVLAHGIDFGILSVGVLADDLVLDELRTASSRNGCRAQVIAGAIGGIDALAAAGPYLETVTYTARKPPMSWRGSPAEETHDLAQIEKPTCVFSGSAREAALRFPKNANVVATVALAAMGFENTDVSLIADPAARGNTHEIAAAGGGFDFSYTTTGTALAANPRTSALTALSAIRAIRQRSPGLVI
jgi:aspartate dehydrogenase